MDGNDGSNSAAVNAHQSTRVCLFRKVVMSWYCLVIGEAKIRKIGKRLFGWSIKMFVACYEFRREKEMSSERTHVEVKSNWQ